MVREFISFIIKSLLQKATKYLYLVEQDANFSSKKEK